jgi:hypothetical protein
MCVCRAFLYDVSVCACLRSGTLLDQPEELSQLMSSCERLSQTMRDAAAAEAAAQAVLQVSSMPVNNDML